MEPDRINKATRTKIAPAASQRNNLRVASLAALAVDSTASNEIEERKPFSTLGPIFFVSQRDGAQATREKTDCAATPHTKLCFSWL
jgi:hypothetical protein